MPHGFQGMTILCFFWLAGTLSSAYTALKHFLYLHWHADFLEIPFSVVSWQEQQASIYHILKEFLILWIAVGDKGSQLQITLRFFGYNSRLYAR